MRVGALRNKGAHYGIALVRRGCEAGGRKWLKCCRTYDDEAAFDGRRNRHIYEKSPAGRGGAESIGSGAPIEATDIDAFSAQRRISLRKRRASKCALRAAKGWYGAAYGAKGAERHGGRSLQINACRVILPSAISKGPGS